MLGRQYKWDLILNVHMRTKRWHRSITKSLMVFSMQVIFNHKSGIIVIQTWLSFRPILKTFKILLTTSYRTNIKPSTPTTANSRSKMTSLTTIIIRADSDQCIWVFLKIQTPLKTLHSTRWSTSRNWEKLSYSQWMNQRARNCWSWMMQDNSLMMKQYPKYDICSTTGLCQLKIPI